MSTMMMAAVWPLVMPTTAKILLVSLADQANDDGVCWPSVRSLMERTNMSDRAVRKWLQWLRERGALRVEARERRNGSATSNVYTVDPDAFMPEGGAAAGVPEAVEGGASPGPDPLHDVQDPLHHVQGTLHHVQGPPAPCAGPPEPPYESPDESIPPVAPLGGAGRDGKPSSTSESQGAGKAGRKRAALITVPQWLAECKARGERPIPADDPIHAYCRQAGIGEVVHWLHWEEFKRRRTAAGGKQRGVVGWRAQYRRSVEENWFRLWCMVDGHQGTEARLTSVGVQAQRFHEAAEREAGSEVAA